MESAAEMILLKANFFVSWFWRVELIHPCISWFVRKSVFSVLKWVLISWSKSQMSVAKASSISKEMCLIWLLHLLFSIYLWPGEKVKRFRIKSKWSALSGWACGKVGDVSSSVKCKLRIASQFFSVRHQVIVEQTRKTYLVLSCHCKSFQDWNTERPIINRYTSWFRFSCKLDEHIIMLL